MPSCMKVLLCFLSIDNCQYPDERKINFNNPDTLHVAGLVEYSREVNNGVNKYRINDIREFLFHNSSHHQQAESNLDKSGKESFGTSEQITESALIHDHFFY